MRKIIIAFLLPTALLYAPQKTRVHHPEAEVPYEPWFIGPFLAPTAVNMEVGHPGIMTSLIILNNYGAYDSNWKFENQKNIWGISPSIDFQFAITENTGVEILASFATNFRDGKSSTRFLDTLLLLGYQALHDQKDSWIPDLRLFFQAIFPSGQHDRLDPIRVAIDFSGQGAYFFGPNIAMQKLFYLRENFFLLHLAFGYFFPTRARIRDFNAYGGGIGTKGTIRPGQSLAAFISGEYSFNQRWVFAYDTVFLYQGKTSRFKGDSGFTDTGDRAIIGLPSSSQISIAPTLEYNFSPQSGLLAGVWFTIAGRNSNAFASGFLSFGHIF